MLNIDEIYLPDNLIYFERPKNTCYFSFQFSQLLN